MTIQILHVGVGLRGRSWLEFVRDHPDMRSAACVDSQGNALREAELVLPSDAGSYESLPEALEHVSADAALVASPSALHEEHVLACIDAGLAVLVEKPLAPDVEAARRMIDHARRARRPLVVAEQFRFVPAERTVRKLVMDGVLGRLSNATLVDRRRMPAGTQGDWMATIEYPQLQEVAVHHFDSLRSFFDRNAVEISARVWNPPSDYAHGSSTQAMIEMEDDLHVNYLGTLTSHKFEYRLVVEGDGGILWTDRKRVFLRKKGARLFLPVRKVKVPPGDEAPYPKEGTTSLLNSLRDAILEEVPAETRAQDNIETIALMQAGKISDRERRPVALSELLAR